MWQLVPGIASTVPEPIAERMQRTIILSALFALNLFPTFGQFGANDPTFNPADVGFGQGVGARTGSDLVLASAVQPDGRILIGGMFASYNMWGDGWISRVNADGSRDTTFNSSEQGPDGHVYAVALQDDGKILVGGYFTTCGSPDQSCPRLARLNTDGSRDMSFTGSAGGGATYVYSIAVQPDGKILVGGSFQYLGGLSRYGVGRLLSTGAGDATFNPGSGPNGQVHSIAVQPDGKVIVAGTFTTFNGISRPRVARLNADGSLDTSFDPGTGADMAVRACAVRPDGKILIGGDFTAYDGTAAGHLVQLNADGSVDASFNTGAGADDLVYSLSLLPDGRCLVGGSFASFGGAAVAGLVQLQPDGTIDPTFDAQADAGASVRTTSLTPDGGVIAGGGFWTLGGEPCTNLAKLEAQGSMVPGFNPVSACNNGVEDCHVLTDGRILLAGSFTAYSGHPAFRIIRLLPDGDRDPAFDSGTGAEDGGINKLLVDVDGRIIIVGSFWNYNGASRRAIARLNADGDLDTSFDPGTGASYKIYSAAFQPDGKIVIVGYFSSYDGVPRECVARINADGSLDPTFDPGVGPSNYVEDCAVQADGKIIIAGRFDSYAGVNIKGLARLNADGTLDTGFLIGPGLGGLGMATTCTLQDDGKILVSGVFNSVNGTPVSNRVRLLPDGTVDPTFTCTAVIDAPIRDFLVQSDGKIIAGGSFTTYDGLSMPHLLRFNSDGTVDPSFEIGAGTDGHVYTVAEQAPGNLLIGGYFTSYNGTGRNFIARLLNDNSTLVPSSVSADNTLFPNPTDGSFTVTPSDANITELIVHDALGRTILKRTITRARPIPYPVDLGGEPAGVYFVTLIGQDQIRTTRLVKR